MPSRIFAITIPNDTIVLNDKGRGEASFTAVNTSQKPVTGAIKVLVQGGCKQEWIQVGGEKERKFGPGETHQIPVQIQPPADAPKGKYTFRLNLASTQNPDEEFTEGPLVGFEIKRPVDDGGQTHPFPIWLIVLIAVLVLGGIGGGIAFALKNRSVGVPALAGRSLTEATNLLQGVHLTVSKCVATNAGTAGLNTVLNTEPKAGEAVKKGTGVVLFYEAGVPKTKVPQLTRLPISKVKEMLSASKLIYQVKETRLTGKQSPDTVLEQSPAPDEWIETGGQVILVVEGNSVLVPDVSSKRSLTLESALLILNKAGLTVLNVYHRSTSITQEWSKVVAQNPAPQTRVAPGTSLDLTVGGPRGQIKISDLLPNYKGRFPQLHLDQNLNPVPIR